MKDATTASLSTSTRARGDAQFSDKLRSAIREAFPATRSS
jgi:hypothetical protein